MSVTACFVGECAGNVGLSNTGRPGNKAIVVFVEPHRNIAWMTKWASGKSLKSGLNLIPCQVVVNSRRWQQVLQYRAVRAKYFSLAKMAVYLASHPDFATECNFQHHPLTHTKSNLDRLEFCNNFLFKRSYSNILSFVLGAKL